MYSDCQLHSVDNDVCFFTVTQLTVSERWKRQKVLAPNWGKSLTGYILPLSTTRLWEKGHCSLMLAGSVMPVHFVVSYYCLVVSVGFCRHNWCGSYHTSVPRTARHVLCLSHASQVARSRNLLHRQNGTNAVVVKQESWIHESVEPGPWYVRLSVACRSSHTSYCSPCVFTRGFVLFVTAALYRYMIFVGIINNCHVTYALMLVIVVVASDVWVCGFFGVRLLYCII